MRRIAVVLLVLITATAAADTTIVLQHVATYYQKVLSVPPDRLIANYWHLIDAAPLVRVWIGDSGLAQLVALDGTIISCYEVEYDASSPVPATVQLHVFATHDDTYTLSIHDDGTALFYARVKSDSGVIRDWLGIYRVVRRIR